MIGRLLASLTLVLAVAPAASAQWDKNQRERRYHERSPLSPLAEQTKRLRWKKTVLEDKASEYDLSQESFRLYRPKRFRRKRTYGLIVWSSPGEQGVFPPSWEKIFDKRRLIVIGPNKSGNDRPVPVRIGLALDAVSNIMTKYKIDPERVYVMGFSGGGNMASLLALHYPDVFRGAIYMGGCLYYRDVPVPGKPGSVWKGGMARPSDALLALAKERTRHVYLVGAEDVHAHEQSKAVYELTKADGFRYTAFHHVPRMGHDFPKKKRLERALKYLDAPPKARATLQGEPKEGGG